MFSSFTIITSVKKTLSFFPSLCFYDIPVYLVFSVHKFLFSDIFYILKAEKERILEPIKSLAPLRCVVMLHLFFAELSRFLVLSAYRRRPISRTGFIQSFLLKDMFDYMKDRVVFFFLLFSQITKLVRMATIITRSLNTIEFSYFIQQ